MSTKTNVQGVRKGIYMLKVNSAPVRKIIDALD